MKRSFLRSIIPVALIAGTVFVPATASATQILPSHDGETHACEVTTGSLKWGFKESFRSYISGAIGQGQWNVSNGATYEIPQFGWDNPAGEFDPETGAGNVSFTGSVQFVGHGGVLDMTVSNPTVEIAADGSARMLADVRSNDTDGNLKVDATQVEVATLGNLGTLNTDATEHQYTDVETLLSVNGVDAFGGFYEAGAVLDPITLNFTVSDCQEAAVVVEEAAPEATEASPEQVVTTTEETNAGGSIWLPVGIVAGALVIAGAVTAIVLARRKKAGEVAPETTANISE